jgi:cytochrome P450
MNGSRPRTTPAITYPVERGSGLGPSPELVRLHESGEIHRLAFIGPENEVGWLVVGHATSREVLADPRFVKVLPEHSGFPQLRFPRIPVNPPQVVNPPPREQESLLLEVGGQLIGMHVAEQTALRRRIARHFTVRSVNEMTDEVARVVDEACDDLERAGAPADLVPLIAVAVPLRAISRFVGVADPRALGDPDDGIRPVGVADPGVSDDPDERSRHPRRPSLHALELAIAEGLAQGRGVAGPEYLVKRLVADGFDGREALGVGMAIAMAGFDTTAHLMAATLLALLAEPARWVALSESPERIPRAIEEAMRFLSVGRQDAHVRVAQEDVVVAGEQIRAGEWVHVSTAAANHDPDVFADPARFDLDRDASGHVMFGFGPRQCLGQNLVRLELRLTLEALVCRFPTLRLAVPVTEVPLVPEEALLFAPTELKATW